MSVPKACMLYTQFIAFSHCQSYQKLREFVSVLDEAEIKSPLEINVAPNCSCGRFFEQHPTIIEDTEGEKLEVFLRQLHRGFCKCLSPDYKTNGSAWATARKTWLHVLAALGNLQLVELVVAKCKYDLNAASSPSHHTALSLAVMQTQSDIVGWLCAQPGIDLNIKSKREKHTPLIDAMLAEKYHIVDMLACSPRVDLNAKNFRGETPLVVAVRMNNPRLVRTLLRAGADHSMSTADRVLPLMLAVGFTYQVVKEFVEAKVPLDNLNEYGESALTLAIRHRAEDVVDTLIRGGASCRANPALPALVLAASLGHIRILAYLLNLGQTPDQTDDLGWTALHYACLRGFHTMVELLLDQGANADMRTSCDNTPLSLAVFHRHTSIALMLISCGCEVNTHNEDLDSPLHYAAFHSDRDITTALLDHGAKACTYNCAGSTPLFNAVLSDSLDMAKMLIPHYVDVDLHTPSLGFTYGSWETKTDFHFSDPKSLLWVAASNLNSDMVSLLLLAGCNASSEDWIHNREFPDNINVGEHADLLRYLVDSASTPSALLLLSRVVVRRALGPGKQRAVNQLNLVPRKVKYYISLRQL